MKNMNQLQRNYEQTEGTMSLVNKEDRNTNQKDRENDQSEVGRKKRICR